MLECSEGNMTFRVPGVIQEPDAEMKLKEREGYYF